MKALASIGQTVFGRYLVALQYPDFRTMWLANLSAQAAAWALIVTRGWLVYDMTHDSAKVGMVTFAAMAPLLFMPPIAGVLADRVDRRTVLASSYAVNLAHNLVLAALAFTGVMATWHLILLALVNGMARATQMPVSQALAANLVPRDKLLNALSLTSATQHASRLVGPGLVAPLLGFAGGAPAAFLLCSALYGLGWYQVRRIKTASTGGVKKGEGFVQSFGAGLRYAWGQPVIRTIIAIVVLHCGLTMAYESLLPKFSANQLGAGNTGFATLMMGVGTGGLVGSMFVGGVLGMVARGRLFLIMGVLSGLGQVLLSLTSHMGLAMVGAGLMGASQAAFMTLGQSVTQTIADDAYRGRIASLNTLSLGGVMSVMNLANGFLGNEFSAATLLAVNGLLFVGVMALSVPFPTPRSLYIKGMPGGSPGERVPVAVPAG